MSFYFYVKVTGKDQGAFHSDSPHAGEGRSLCYRFTFEGSSSNDPNREAANASRSHEPLSIVKAWGPSSPQFLQAFWHNEILKEVVLEFVRPEEPGKTEVPFENIVLKNATVAFFKRRAGTDFGGPAGAPPELEEIGFRFEEMTVKSVPGKTVAKYDWKNRA